MTTSKMCSMRKGMVFALGPERLQRVPGCHERLARAPSSWTVVPASLLSTSPLERGHTLVVGLQAYRQCSARGLAPDRGDDLAGLPPGVRLAVASRLCDQSSWNARTGRYRSHTHQCSAESLGPATEGSGVPAPRRGWPTPSLHRSPPKLGRHYRARTQKQSSELYDRSHVKATFFRRRENLLVALTIC
jgi:hypothetical protein